MYKNGLVLEGGGSRAIYSSGVLDAFLENGISFPYVIGVSAGTCNGASFLGKAKRRQHDIFIDYVNDKRYMSFSNFVKKGEYLDGDWIFGELSYDINPLNQEEFERSGSVFCCVVTNAKTGKAEYLYPKDLRERGCPEIRASCSLPGVTKGCEIGGQLYYDGGLVDSIPLERALDDGCEKAVVILTQHKGYTKPAYKPYELKIEERLLKKYPLMAEALNTRPETYNAQLDYVYKMQEAGLAYVIQPLTPLDCSTLEKSKAKLEAIYLLGYNQAKRTIEEVKEFMK